jgi:hypothetical protein
MQNTLEYEKNIRENLENLVKKKMLWAKKLKIRQHNGLFRKDSLFIIFSYYNEITKYKITKHENSKAKNKGWNV